MYIDGHEREDVIRHQKVFLKTLHDLRDTHRPPPPASDEPTRIRCEVDENKKELVIIYDDKSIFNTNEGQSWMWGEEDRPAILPKTKGSGIMVSDFVKEHGGYIRLTDAEFETAKEQYPDLTQNAKQLLEYGAEQEGYWTDDWFMQQIESAANIADFKYNEDHYTLVW